MINPIAPMIAPMVAAAMTPPDRLLLVLELDELAPPDVGASDMGAIEPAARNLVGLKLGLMLLSGVRVGNRDGRIVGEAVVGRAVGLVGACEGLLVGLLGLIVDLVGFAEGDSMG